MTVQWGCIGRVGLLSAVPQASGKQYHSHNSLTIAPQQHGHDLWCYCGTVVVLMWCYCEVAVTVILLWGCCDCGAIVRLLCGHFRSRTSANTGAGYCGTDVVLLWCHCEAAVRTLFEDGWMWILEPVQLINVWETPTVIIIMRMLLFVLVMVLLISCSVINQPVYQINDIFKNSNYFFNIQYIINLTLM